MTNETKQEPKELTVPQAGQQVTHGMTTQMDAPGDLAARALAKQAEAQVQARYLMAMKNPRDLMEARERIMLDCRRPSFAKKAIYKKPIGRGVEGPSIRLAEALARAMKNVLTDVSAIYDDPQRRVVRVTASDLEANVTYTKDVTIHKVVERRSAEGRKVISQRQNSQNQITYLVEGTDDEILDRENALGSKAMRTCLLRLMPGDLVDDAVAMCYETMAKKDAEDPLGAVKNMVDDFASIAVMVEQLIAYLGHPLENAQPKEMRDLKGIFNAIEAGEATWSETMAAREKDAAVVKSEPAADQKQPPKNLADLTAKSKDDKKGKEEKKPPEPGSSG